MARKRVLDIAEELGLELPDLLAMLRRMDVGVRNHMSEVSPADLARLHAWIERARRGKKPLTQRKATTRKRRRRRRRRRRPAEIASANGVVEGAATAEAQAKTEAKTQAKTDDGKTEAGEPSADPVDVTATDEGRIPDRPLDGRPSAPVETATTTSETVAAEPAKSEEKVADPVTAGQAEPEQEEAPAPDVPSEKVDSEAGDQAEPVAAELQKDDDGADTKTLDPAEQVAGEVVGEAPESEKPEPEKEEQVGGEKDAPPKTDAPKKAKVRPAAKRPPQPKPVRVGIPAAKKPKAKPKLSPPKVSAAPGGTVRISAEGYTVDGRRKGRTPDGRKKRPPGRGAARRNLRKTFTPGGRGSARKRRREMQARQREAEREQRELEKSVERVTVRVNEFLTVAELADLISSSPQAIITSAFKNLGLMVTINQRLDFDQIELICEEAGYTAIREEAFQAEVHVTDPVDADSEEEGVPRPPIVTVMGHVDHGKTLLLDAIRSTNVVAGEAGGITQHIGASHVHLDDDRRLTFLDTPGHEAFTAMRARGADLTDIVILVVAADDAVMPQTVEAISHAKNAAVPMVVAINKADLPSADIDKVKRDLLSHEVVLEDFGGEVLGGAVSAKTGVGIDDLLDRVLLQAELLELTANPDRDARGTVVEAQIDRGKGPVATVLVQQGTLRVGDNFVCGLHGGRVRAMLDERGASVREAGPGIPVRVLGIQGVPQAGDRVTVLAADKVREIVTRRQQLEREKDIRRQASGTRLADVFQAVRESGQARLNVVIKGDTDGSVQALSDSLERLSTEEVSVQVIHRGVGGINESDILLASTSEAIVIGFHVRADAGALNAAERDSVEIRFYNVIYEAIEEIRMALEGLLAPEERENTRGIAEIRELFRVPKVGTVAGCYVQSGTMVRRLPVRLLRENVQIYEGRMESLRRFKEDVQEVRDGYECGIAIENYNDIKIGDLIECYEVVEVARTLA